MAENFMHLYHHQASPQRERASGGGDPTCRDVMGYEPPTGPKYIMNTGVGLRGGTNFGNRGSQGKHTLNAEGSGSPTDLNTDHTLLGGSQRG